MEFGESSIGLLTVGGDCMDVYMYLRVVDLVLMAPSLPGIRYLDSGVCQGW